MLASTAPPLGPRGEAGTPDSSLLPPRSDRHAKTNSRDSSLSESLQHIAGNGPPFGQGSEEQDQENRNSSNVSAGRGSGSGKGRKAKSRTLGRSTMDADIAGEVSPAGGSLDSLNSLESLESVDTVDSLRTPNRVTSTASHNSHNSRDSRRSTGSGSSSQRQRRSSTRRRQKEKEKQKEAQAAATSAEGFGGLYNLFTTGGWTSGAGTSAKRSSSGRIKKEQSALRGDSYAKERLMQQKIDLYNAQTSSTSASSSASAGRSAGSSSGLLSMTTGERNVAELLPSPQPASLVLEAGDDEDGRLETEAKQRRRRTPATATATATSTSTAHESPGSELGSDLQRISSEVAAFQNKVQAAETARERDAQAFSEQRSALEGQLQDVTRQKEALEAARAAVADEARALKEANTVLKHDAADLKHSQQTDRMRSEELASQMVVSVQRVEGIQARLGDAEAALGSAQAAEAAAVRELGAAKAEFALRLEDATKQQAAAGKDLELRMRHVQCKLDEKEEDLAVAKGQYDRLVGSQSKALEHLMGVHERELAVQKTGLESGFLSQREALERRHREAGEAAARSAEEAQAARRAAEELTREAARADAVGALEARLAAKEERVAELERELRNKQSKLDSAMRQLQAEQEAHGKEAAAQVAALQAALDEKERQLEALTEEMQKKQSQLEAERAQRAKLSLRMKDAGTPGSAAPSPRKEKAKLRSLEQQVAAKQVVIEGNSEEIQRLKRENASAKQKLAKAKAGAPPGAGAQAQPAESPAATAQPTPLRRALYKLVLATPFAVAAVAISLTAPQPGVDYSIPN